MINPVNHARSAAEVATYRVEPYVVAADVYARAPHVGRGGWTWYTGSAGWMYRLIVESLLGVRLEDGRLRVKPCIPADWDGFALQYRHGDTVYRIDVRRAAAGAGEPIGKTRIVMDGNELADTYIPHADDRRKHRVEVVLSEASA
jgi:cellobiose phosphorylase